MLTLELRDRSDTLVHEWLMRFATRIDYETVYPAGIYLMASFFIPGKWDLNASQIRLGYKLRIWDGADLVWEGEIETFEPSLAPLNLGTTVRAIGTWALYFEKRSVNKPWADDRISAGVWKWREDAGAADKVHLGRQDSLRFVPKAEAFTNGQGAIIRYVAPDGETIKRVVCDAELQESGQAWQITLYDVTNTTAIWTDSASGSTAHDDTLSPAASIIEFRFVSGASQTPTSDGTYFAEITNLVVYTETGNINVYEIANDMQAMLSGEVSADDDWLDSALTKDLTPFYNPVRETMAATLMRAVAQGDASGNSLAVGLRSSELTSDGLPPLFLEVQPDGSDFEYEITSERAAVGYRKSLTEVANWAAVIYQDLNGHTVEQTPDDTAALEDTASQSDYGERHAILGGGSLDAASADDLGIRHITRNKNPMFTVVQTIRIVGFVRGKKGDYIPAAHIQAGKRIRITNFVDEIQGDQALTAVITHTRYDHNSRTCEVTIGLPPHRKLQQRQRPAGPISFVNYVFP